MDYLQKIVWNGLKGSTEKNPADLAEIIGIIDANEKIIATVGELNAVIGALIQERKIAETGRLKFYDPAGTPTAKTFTPISDAEHKAAHKIYTERFELALKAVEADPGEFSRHKLTVRWKLPGDSSAEDADEEQVDELAARLDEILARSRRAEVNGYEFGPGLIDILIFGRETDDDIESIYGDIVSAVRTTECPRGSCIIRHYEEGKKDKVSDVFE